LISVVFLCDDDVDLYLFPCHHTLLHFYIPLAVVVVGVVEEEAWADNLDKMTVLVVGDTLSVHMIVDEAVVADAHTAHAVAVEVAQLDDAFAMDADIVAADHATVSDMMMAHAAAA